MGIYDRDYFRETQRSGIGGMRMWSFTTWLIVMNVAVFVVGSLVTAVRSQELIEKGINPGHPSLRWFTDPFEFWGAFSIDAGLFKLQVWRIITCQFLHANLWHLLMNMIGLWMFGPIVESRLGSRRYGFFYMLCGIAGPLMFTVLSTAKTFTAHPPAYLVASLNTDLVGASAGIFGIMLAAAYLEPERIVYVYFFEMRLRYFAWLMMGIAAYTVIVHGHNAGGQAAHLGGGLVGWFLIRAEGVLDVVAAKRVVRGRRVKDWSRDLNR